MPRSIPIRFFRGNYADQPLLNEGEPGFSIDEGLLSIGDGTNNVLIGKVFQDVFSNRPTAGISGRLFRATDTKDLFLDNGSSWIALFDAILKSDSDFPSTDPSRETLLWHTTNENLYLFVPSMSSWINISGTDGGGNSITWREVSSNDNVEAGDGIFINCFSNSVTLTLPTSPEDGDRIAFLHVQGDQFTNTITIARNGNDIQGKADDLIIDIQYANFNLVFRSNTSDWRVF